MAAKYADVEFFQEMYLGKRVDPGIGKSISYFAKKMLLKAKIAKNIESAHAIVAAREKARSDGDRKLVQSLSKILFDLHEYILDEAAIVSSFELFSKATLFKKQYLIHVIKSPQRLRDKQKRHPIHRATYRACIKRGEKPTINYQTLSASQLLEKGYHSKVGLPSHVLKEIGKFNKDRNLLHLHVLPVYGLDSKAIKGIRDLKMHIDAAC